MHGPAVLALTTGDPAGIGPEITLRAWLERDARSLPPFLAIGDPALYRGLAGRLGWPVPVREVTPREAASVFANALPVLPLGLAVPAQPGHPDHRNAGATIASIDRAVALVRSGEVAALVTNPISKAVLYEAGFRHPGHTEYLAALAAPMISAPAGAPPPRSVMMLWSETLAVVPVTIHVALREVPDRLDREAILATARITARDLRGRFGIARPRLAVCGLNPHAGEGGAMGREEIELIAPAVATLRQEGLEAVGPLPADTMFHPRARARYDVALAMYHDQALIPLKTLAFDDGVNVTLGLPFIRTSPDHGTAFDIAGRGQARPDSLAAALRLAGRLARTEAEHRPASHPDPR